MSYCDLTGFADYLRDHGASLLQDATSAPRFLVVSSEIHGGLREASFRRRQQVLGQKVPGAKLAWIRVRDLVRFGLAIEQAGVSPGDRESIRWDSILDTGDVCWDAFGQELQRLTACGYSFSEAA